VCKNTDLGLSVNASIVTNVKEYMMNKLFIAVLGLMVSVAPAMASEPPKCTNQEVSHTFPDTTDGKTSWVFKSDCSTSQLDAIMATWAKDNGYHPHEKKHDGQTLWYQRGTGTATLPFVVVMAPVTEGTYTLDAFLFAHAINRGILFGQYTKINSGGFRGVALRAIARKQINPLVTTLGLTPAD
jgi:hypothetical protein